MNRSIPTCSFRKAAFGLQIGYAGWGIFWGAWGVLLPQFRSDLALSDAAVGMALMGISIGAIPAMLYGSSFIQRRPEFALRILFCSFAASVLALGFAGNALQLVGLLGLIGITSGLLDVALNVNVAAVESRSGQRLFQRMHGVFPLGVIVAAPIVGYARDIGLGRYCILSCIAVLMLIPIIFLDRGSRARSSVPVRRNHVPFSTRWSEIRQLTGVRNLLLASALVITFLFLEHAIEQWSTLYVEIRHGTSASMASLAPSLYMAALFIGRMGAQSLERRLPLSHFLRWGAGGTALCFFVIAYGGQLWLTLVAVTLMGLLMAPLVPGLYGWIGRTVPEQQRGRVLGGVTAMSYLGYLASPIFVGGMSSIVGLGNAWAMLGVVAALVLMAVTMQRGL